MDNSVVLKVTDNVSEPGIATNHVACEVTVKGAAIVKFERSIDNINFYEIPDISLIFDKAGTDLINLIDFVHGQYFRVTANDNLVSVKIFVR